jgi:asparagine synthase (glutamine-hydrolysing)
MCGICGILGKPEIETVARMASLMVHRGPDDDGFYADDQIALGFRRLAIIDVAGGRQPLSNEDRSIWVVFNGEIYNHKEIRRWLEEKGHRLNSCSDGEILSHLYEELGPQLVERLNGIFAFALWDRSQQMLLLARDHHGVKPLYYAQANGSFLFASELKAILASGRVQRRLDPEAVAQYMVYQVVPPPLSIVSGICQLSPGSILIHKGGIASVRSFWKPPQESPKPVTDVREAAELVRTGLEQAVERQLMSERPLGVFLSGGVDSSALVAMSAVRTSGRLKTFSVGFRGADEELYTEWPWAKLVAERYDTEHHEVVLTEEMFFERLPHVLWSMDQPTSDGINSYYVSLAAAQHVTVALSGTGGDELFLGYPRDLNILERYRRSRIFHPLPVTYANKIGRILAAMPDEMAWKPVLEMKEALRSYVSLGSELVSPRGIAIFEEEERDRLLSRDYFGDPRRLRHKTDFLIQDVPPDPARPGDWLSRLEQRAYLSFVLLRDIDVMSMTHSLEVRVPFLDIAYSEILSRIPWQWKLHDGIGKWILKSCLRDLLPDEVLYRPKMGFGLPYNVWMRRSLEPMLRDTLDEKRVRERGLFNALEVRKLVEQFYSGDDGVWRRLWTLFVLEAWAMSSLDSTAADVGYEWQHAVAGVA